MRLLAACVLITACSGVSEVEDALQIGIRTDQESYGSQDQIVVTITNDGTQSFSPDICNPHVETQGSDGEWTTIGALIEACDLLGRPPLSPGESLTLSYEVSMDMFIPGVAHRFRIGIRSVDGGELTMTSNAFRISE